MKLDERMSRVCKAVIKGKGGYFEESKIKKNNTFLVIPYVLFDSFDVFTIILQCRKYKKNT